MTISGRITLTPLSGPYPSPPSYLLTVDNANILLDCGAYDHSPESFLTPSSSASSSATSEYLQKLKDLAPTLHLVLLTHPLVGSVGLLPWLKSRCGLKCPVYATLPTREMGRWAVEEWVMARSAEEKNEHFVDGKEKASVGKKGKGKGKEGKVIKEEVKEEDEDLGVEGKDPWDVVWKVSRKEIRDAFLCVNAVRWTQPVHLSGALKGYTLVAHRSGHTLGGSLYTLRPSLSSSLSPASSSSSLLYAPIFNHIKEHHLDGAALLNGAKIDEAMRRMGVVVVGADRSLTINVKRIDRERALLDLITSTLSSGGSLLMPTDPSARLLELLVLLESHWNFANLGQRFPLCLISKTGREVVGFVRSLTEWMGGQIGGDEAGERVLKFVNLRVYSSIEELNSAIPHQVPKLILTVPATLSHGYSRALFTEFARSPNNVVILTSRGEEGTLARWLWGVWNEKQAIGEKWGEGHVGRAVELSQTVELAMKRKVILQGLELEDYLEAERIAAELEAKREALLERSRRMMQEDAESDSDSDADGSDTEVAAPTQDSKMDGTGARRRFGGFAGGAGAWDEFLDPLSLQGSSGQSFDVYVKGAYSKRVGGEGREAMGRFRMFPVVERKRRVDVYGEAIDVEGWLRRGVEDQSFKPVIAPVAVVKRVREEDEEVEDKPEPPHKYVVDQVVVNLMCTLFVVDMEGQADGRALKTILPQINPRKLVIVNGNEEAVADLAAACRSVASMTQEIYTPAVGECITVGEETKNFSVRLGDTIMATLKMSRVEDYDVAYVSGIIHMDAESDIPVLETTSSTRAILPPLPPPTDLTKMDEDPTSLTNVLPPLPASLFIGDLRLTVLQDRLNAIGVPSEFVGSGILVCGPAPPESFGFVSSKDLDPRMGTKAMAEATAVEAADAAGGKVAVKKSGRGKLIIEGTPGETYHVVRKVVYSLHAHAG